MSKPQLIKSSGWFFIAGAIAFITILSNSDPVAIPGSVLSSILLAVGMSRLRAAYGETVGRLGTNFLFLGMLAPVLWVVSVAFMAIMGEEAVREGLWVFLFVGPAISLVGLTLFGLAAWISRPMPRLNWLPVFAGVWYPVFYFFLVRYLYTHNGVYPGQYQWAFTIMHSIEFVALLALGISLNDTSQEIATV
jgi:hypothetical protein